MMVNVTVIWYRDRGRRGLGVTVTILVNYLII